jgi:hypothetical protein
MFNKDFYYKKYLKYKNKYITLQSQLGGRTIPISLNDLPDAISSENDDIPLRPFRQNATSGRPVDVSLGALPDAISSENDDIPLRPFRQNATSGRPVDVSSAPPLVPPPLGRQNAVDVFSGPPTAIRSENEIDTVPIIPFRQNATSGIPVDVSSIPSLVPPPLGRQNTTRGVRARIPSVSSIGPPPVVRQYAVDVSSGHLPDAISSENNYTFVPLPSYSQNTTRCVRARVPSAPFSTSSPAASGPAASGPAASGPVVNGPAVNSPTDSASVARAASAAARADPNDAPSAIPFGSPLDNPLDENTSLSVPVGIPP